VNTLSTMQGTNNINFLTHAFEAWTDLLPLPLPLPVYTLRAVTVFIEHISAYYYYYYYYYYIYRLYAEYLQLYTCKKPCF